jgi:GntR family transcriptional regulator
MKIGVSFAMSTTQVPEQARPDVAGPVLSGVGPLWRQVREDLQTRLTAGQFTAGFPGEHALAQQYAASRHTIREALRSLRSDGVVTAARGRASTVAEPTLIQQQMGGALYSLFASVEAAGLIQRSIVRRLDIRADGVVAARLGLEESTPLVHLERLRLAGEEPLALDRVWLPASWAAPLLAVDFTHTSLYEQLHTCCGIRLTGGQERIRAVVPTAAEQRLLGNPDDVAALALDRLGCADGVPTEWRHTLIRADRFSLTAQFTPSSYRFDSTSPLPHPQLQGALLMSTPDITVPGVDPAVAAALVDSGDALLVDVREDDEWAAGHSPKATHMPLAQLNPVAIPHGAPVITICRSGARSARAAATLAAAGIAVSNLDGGMKAWAAAGLPIVTDTGAPGTLA